MVSPPRYFMIVRPTSVATGRAARLTVGMNEPHDLQYEEGRVKDCTDVPANVTFYQYRFAALCLQVVRIFDDKNGDFRMLHHIMADTAEEQLLQRAEPSAADYDQIRLQLFGVIEQGPRRISL